MATTRRRAALPHVTEPSRTRALREPVGLSRLLPKGRGPFDDLEWRSHDAVIKSPSGELIFEMKGIKAPKTWGETAINIAASKYFRMIQGRRENSVEGMVRRVGHWMAQAGLKLGYFDAPEEAAVLEDNLNWLIIHQMASHNSPVWFNVGVREPPQCSACFIQSATDSMDSIMTLARSEAMLFKGGSGTGSNLSMLRSSKERLSGGGLASGPVTFMRAFDAFAGVIKSGGTTRRAAKMVILNVDHPDVQEFIECKVKEEEKAMALIREGYSANFDGTDPDSAYASISYQNANHSVRLSDTFMQGVEKDGVWATHWVTDPSKVARTYKARDLFREMAQAAWRCGDPGVQFDDVINDWHTCPNTARINASNPCSEYMFLDDSACNLASFNLMKFLREDGEFDLDLFIQAVRTFIFSMEVIVDASSYPTEPIAANSRDFRPLGLGYANLGSLIMRWGLAYDSEEARTLAGAISAILSAEGYRMSAEISKRMGPFAGFEKNRAPMLRVMSKHREAAHKLTKLPGRIGKLVAQAQRSWDACVEEGELYGFRNSQISVIAPTGTIGLLMGCDTLGLEPELALVKLKNLVGGGTLKMVNSTAQLALKELGYTPEQVSRIVNYVGEKGTIEGCSDLRPEHLAVFDTALGSGAGTRTISPMGHLKMLTAVQPFLSGSASKTINLPNQATVEDIERIYLEAWRMGAKCVSVYRDGCKASQPYETGKAKREEETPPGILAMPRKRLPDVRDAITHHFKVGEHDGYVTVGLYPAAKAGELGRPGEIFFRVTKEGSTVNGLMDALGISMSMALQHGVPLKDLVRKLARMRFEPAGMTNNPDVRFALSIPDYVARWLAGKFLTVEERRSIGLETHDEAAAPAPPATTAAADFKSKTLDSFGSSETVDRTEDAPSCYMCGGIMVRSGTCYACTQCGATSGCS
ncbi:MAG: vitamin B12-dependent ribonucleotide reductase [Euryarchaeota archaeon]|nr:vitamin B12-dependent ribonucleotide reductase [Euryarchaeota archaeon]MDE1836736.1 vitamin B12-dependent ribonucleotide reductase [Euryarchaeota archaeon]MDE1879754.1 vitamin B12-dependent ribonucleotide reductase [Euryarchaeota archaeon]MDE2044720.1 vitamin B12-dependent ribonucleotide reductase [Thermoplasmata archaeon]